VEVNAWFPPKLSILFQPSRYKSLRGGRGSGKSWGAARALLIKGVQEPLRILCAREFQSSIADSVHKLLSDQINGLGLSHFYTVEKASIFGVNGTEFRFAGIKTNPQAIKSYEGVDIVWVEEAANVSNHSWETLIPTIRKPNSEIWITWNPELESDNTWKRFVTNQPPDTLETVINYFDNEMCDNILIKEAEYLKLHDQDAYNNVWLGNPKTFLEGAIYAKQLRLADEEQRLQKSLQYNPNYPVYTAWDLGWNDAMTIVTYQRIGARSYCLHYIEEQQAVIEYFLSFLENLPYKIKTHHLPHDAGNHAPGRDKTFADLLRDKGLDVKVLPVQGLEASIEVARQGFGSVYMDFLNCADLITCLRKYRYNTPKQLGDKTKPIHDSASHGADAFRYMMQALNQVETPIIKIDYSKPKNTNPRAWMSNKR
jgi:phage terminase large subunit